MKINILRILKEHKDRNRERKLKQRTCGRTYVSDLDSCFPSDSKDCLDCKDWYEEDAPFIVKCHTCKYETVVCFKPFHRFSPFTRIDLGSMKMCSLVGTPGWKNEYWLANECPLREPKEEDPYPSWYGITKEEFEFFKTKWLREQNKGGKGFRVFLGGKK